MTPALKEIWKKLDHEDGLQPRLCLGFADLSSTDSVRTSVITSNLREDSVR